MSQFLIATNPSKMYWEEVTFYCFNFYANWGEVLRSRKLIYWSTRLSIIHIRSPPTVHDLVVYRVGWSGWGQMRAARWQLDHKETHRSQAEAARRVYIQPRSCLIKVKRPRCRRTGKHGKSKRLIFTRTADFMLFLWCHLEQVFMFTMFQWCYKKENVSCLFSFYVILVSADLVHLLCCFIYYIGNISLVHFSLQTPIISFYSIV